MPQQALYGGQAVIEGVMMRGHSHYAVAVRAPLGDIRVQVKRLSNVLTMKSRKFPLVRGVLALWEALDLGMRSLHYSASVAAGQEGTELTGRDVALVMATSAIFAIGIFFLVPTALAGWFERFGFSAIAVNLIEGLIRMGMFLGYLFIIGRMEDVKRLFSYHGAEHKTISAFEAGKDLVAEQIQPFPTAHPRCGTAFLLTVAVVSIFVFAFAGQPPMLIRLLSRLLLLPVVAALSFELIRFAGTHPHNPFAKALSLPGLALQAMTTRQPDDSQVEVAVAALNALRTAEEEDRLDIARA